MSISVNMILMPFVAILLIGYILNIITSIWAYRDAIRKGRSNEYAIIVLVATLFFPIVGLIVYLVIRNDQTNH